MRVCNFRNSLLVALFGLFISMGIWASTSYAPLTENIEQRPNKAAELCQQQHANETRRTVQMAYFGVFENLEGSIRINISARRSYEMESVFGGTRRMTDEKKPLAGVRACIDWLKAALRGAEPVLGGGHRLVTRERHSALSRDDIAIHWQESFRMIDDPLTQAVTEYQIGSYNVASQHVQQAHYQGLKNSEMEMSLRRSRFTKDAVSINQQFLSLITLITQPDHFNDVSYRVITLLQDVEDILPGLPTVRDDRQVATAQGAGNISATDEGDNRTDWAKVTTGINQSVQDATAHCQGGDAKNAILDIQDTYLSHFETSGMENKVGSRDSTFKTMLEAYFTRLVNPMKAGQLVKRLSTGTSTLAQDLQKAVTALGEGEGIRWGLLLYSLIVIVCKGLGVLLIAAAIVAYMVKNNHQNKLPLIHQPVIMALIVGVITAAIFQMLFISSDASCKLLGGITILIAVAMLSSMSYWLLSKAEARHWKAWLEGELSHSLPQGSLAELRLTSFLAVYHEGVETVLFYYTLIGDVNTVPGHMTIGAGFVISCVVLLPAWLVIRCSVVRLPLKPFFMFTDSFMYLMAFAFMDKDVLELVEGKLFQPTLINGFPEIGWLGIYPYVEALLPQVVLLLVTLVVLWVVRCESTIPGETIKNNP